MLETLTKHNKVEIVLGMDHNLDLLKANTHKRHTRILRYKL